MPYRTFNTDEVARYLHLTRSEVERLVKNQDIPFERHRDRFVFRKVEIDAWASQRILGLEGQRLTEYHRKSSRETLQISPEAALMPEQLDAKLVSAALPAKTKASVLREMVALVEAAGRLNDPRGLLESLEAREALCSTGIPGGLALLHPRCPDPYLYDTPFIALGRTIQGIPFGSPDGQSTNLFFLIGSCGDRMHLHTLARICLMAQKTALLDELRQAQDAEAMHQCVINCEADVLATVRPPE